MNDHTGLTGSGRYLRIYGTARTTVYGYSIYELEAYGSNTGARMAAPVATHSMDAAAWNVKVSPNPVAGGELQVVSNRALQQLVIVDLSGKIWSIHRGFKASNIYNLDIKKLPRGLYLVQVYNGNQERQVLKFIRQ